MQHIVLYEYICVHGRKIYIQIQNGAWIFVKIEKEIYFDILFLIKS